MELVRDKTKKDTYMCNTLLKMFKRGELRKDHPLQRKAGQWKTETRDGLIVTVIQQEDFDSIKICEQLNENGVTLWLIDGLQRLTTLDSYRNGLFRLGKSIENPIVYYQVARKNGSGEFEKDRNGNYIYDLVAYDLRGKSYKDLPDEIRERFDNYPIDVVKHLNCTDDEVGYHMRRYNRQTSMNSNQNGVTYMDSVAKYVKNIAGNKFFMEGNYTETEKRKGVIDRVISDSIMAMFHLDEWQKQPKKIGLFLNKNASENEFSILDENLNRLEKIVDDTTKKLFNTKNSFIWFAVYNNFLKLELNDIEFSKFLHAFIETLCKEKIEEFDGMSFKEYDKNKSTKDKKVVKAKINAITSLMYKYFGKEKMEDKEEVNVLRFCQENMNEDINRDDIDLYDIAFDDYTIEVDNDSKLLDKKNRPSFIALVAYAFKEELDMYLPAWMSEYFMTHNSYNIDQVKNYYDMKNDFDLYVKTKKSAA